MEEPLKNDQYSRAIRAAITAAGTSQSKVQLATEIPHGSWNRRMYATTRWQIEELQRIADHLDIPLTDLTDLAEVEK